MATDELSGRRSRKEGAYIDGIQIVFADSFSSDA
jgi:hypothetical protein